VPLLRADVLIRRPALLVLLLIPRMLNHRIPLSGSPVRVEARSMPWRVRRRRDPPYVSLVAK
jgi:hypothetical protein